MNNLIAHKKNNCCRNPQQSVLVGGIENISAEAVEEWLKRNHSSIKIVHVVKKALDKDYRHVHFTSEQDASLFFHAMQYKRFNGPKDCQIRFRAAKDFNGDTVVYPVYPVYPQPDQNHQPLSPPASEAQYAIIKKDGVFIIVVNTPGITLKDQIKVSVSDDDDTDIQIIGKLPHYESAQFNVDIKLPEEIDRNSDVKTKVVNGRTTLEIKIKSSKKRKFLNIS